MHMRSDVYECRESVCVEIEVPGFSLAEVEIWVGPDRVEVSIRPEATTRSRLSAEVAFRELVEKPLRFHRRERLNRVCHRVIPLPMDVDAERATAQLREGLLVLDLPICVGSRKPEETSRVRISP